MRGEISTSSDNLVGSVLLGRYRIVRELAKGGMGVVYLARSEGAVGFVKPVVIKLVLPEHATDERFLQMFAREAKILSQLRHPSIVDVIEFGEENGAYVMVLEYVRGYHLGQWSKYLRKKGRPLPVDILLLLLIDVLEALHKAHDMKYPDGSSMHIVHRDVSPSNILLDEDGRARLLDFGVARMRGGDYQTQVRSFVGKLTYSAPEMFQGEEATPQSDVYSCGVVLHEMLFGRNVFVGKNQADTLQLVLNHMPEPIEGRRNDVPAGLDAIIQQATAKHGELRFATALAFATALRGLLSEHESSLRTRLSTTLKADFGEDMAQLLGLESLSARDEAWRRLSLHPPSPSGSIAVEIGTQANPEQRTSKPARPRQNTTGNFTPPPIPTELLQQISANQQHAAFANPVAPPSPAPAANQRGLYIAMGGVAALAIAAILVALRGAPMQQAPVMPAIRVVAEQAPPPPPVVEHAVEPELEPTTELPSRKRASAPNRPTGPDPASLTRAFRKQQSKVEGCFKQHTTSLEGLPRIQLEFDLDAQGKAVRVAVVPTPLSSTPLGQCLRAVGDGTRFPAQGEPVSFAIPITASRGAGGG